MILNIYCQFDRVSGIYSDIFPSVNDDVAIRSYRQMLSSPQQNVFNSFALDKEIYVISQFDDQSGAIIPCQPRLLCRASDFMRSDENGQT